MRLSLPKVLFRRSGKISFRLRFWAMWESICNVIEQFIFARHNARVVADFESRMVAVIHEASGGMMSKPYYTKEVMLDQIREASSRTWDDAYAEGRKDAFEEMGEADPQAES